MSVSLKGAGRVFNEGHVGVLKHGLRIESGVTEALCCRGLLVEGPELVGLQAKGAFCRDNGGLLGFDRSSLELAVLSP
jgi:hypothetical protein